MNGSLDTIEDQSNVICWSQGFRFLSEAVRLKMKSVLIARQMGHPEFKWMQRSVNRISSVPSILQQLFDHVCTSST